MPELPEVEILARHLRPLLRGQTIRACEIRRAKVLRPTRPAALQKILRGAKFLALERRGKYLLFTLRPKGSRSPISLLGHLGMTGRMFLAAKKTPLPKHTAVALDLGAKRFIYEDPRYFGRFTLDVSATEKLGPEPWDEKLTPESFWRQLKKSRQAIKVKLLDQTLIAGIGNIYASEALFRAGLSPRRAADKISRAEADRLLAALRATLADAIAGGSTIPLNFTARKTDGLFYFGRAGSESKYYTERLRVYDRAGQPCGQCGTPLKRIVQAARSTFYCPRCQKN